MNKQTRRFINGIFFFIIFMFGTTIFLIVIEVNPKWWDYLGLTACIYQMYDSLKNINKSLK